MICTKCGNKVVENVVFCTKCGRKIERIQCPHCGKAVDKNAVFCSECGKRITENLAVQEEVVENVAVEAEEQAEKITARDNAEEVRKMNLFEKIEAYQQRGLEYTEDYRQLLKKEKRAYFFWKLKYFIFSAGFLFGIYMMALSRLSYKYNASDGSDRVLIIVGVILLMGMILSGQGFICTKTDKKMGELLAIEDTEAEDDYISDNFEKKRKGFTIYAVCTVFSFILAMIILAIAGEGVLNALILFGILNLLICTVWTFGIGSVVVIIILFVIGVVLTNFYDELLIFYLDQLYESEIVRNTSYPELCMRIRF
ncbi:zinc ribbon domain-containing protein [Anaerotignum faecicola]|nr:zinc ribbon domain-containing protein [Anaerotignum faecicola]